MIQRVSTDPKGIGYVGLAFTRDSTIKVLSIEGVMPSSETVLDGTYPISRANFFYTDGEPNGTARRFLNFVLSDAGQRIAQSVGFVPLQPAP